MNNINKIRRSLFWAIPLFTALFFIGIWIICTSIIPTLNDLQTDSPTVRVSSTSPAAAYASILAPMSIFAGIIHAIPCKISTIKLVDRILLWSGLFGIGLTIFCVLVITPLQSYSMPKLGYTPCNILEDHPTMYFTDWVKNPDWCVRGKSREWVREQARTAQKPVR